jgi:hypothetical protein
VSVSRQTFASQALLHSASRAPQRARGAALGGLRTGRGALALAARASKGGAGATATSPAASPAAAAAVVGRRGLSSRGSSSGGRGLHSSTFQLNLSRFGR